MSAISDIFVIGGGINGCGIARDAAGRGYSVRLAEMNDLASGTSSWSSKLIHGGFRYLEHYEFRLVREALNEREVLMKMAPHIISPMRFVLPHHKAMRPAWLLRLGLMLYDNMGKRELLPGTKSVDLQNSAVGSPLKSLFKKGFEYSDCWVDDARLVALNAMDAQQKGAVIETKTKVISAKQKADFWEITTENLRTGEKAQHQARLLINASGPWVDNVLGEAFEDKNPQNVRLVQGSHIVVPKIHEHDRAYIFQNADNRIVFVLPYEKDYTLIGTTDQDYQGDPSKVKITPAEIRYLCDSVSEYFETPVKEEHIVWTYSGIRPLYDDGATAAQEATRDYVLREDNYDGLKVINVFGGKITTYRKLAESMLTKIEENLGERGEAWTATSQLPGGDFASNEVDAMVNKLMSDYPFIETGLAQRFIRAYGTNSWSLMEGATKISDMGQFFGATLSEREIHYLAKHEWAECADDVLWRRSKLGLHLTQDEIQSVDAWMKENITTA